MATKKSKPKARKFQFVVTVTTENGEDASKLRLSSLREDVEALLEHAAEDAELTRADGVRYRDYVGVTYKAGRITEVQ